MRLFVIFLLFVSTLFGVTKESVYSAYKDKKYKDACYLAAKIYLKYKQDEDFLTLFANSCLKVDNINRMAFPALLLVDTPAARSNAIYFLTILYQKKLLYKSLIDGFDVSGYKFPTTNYILSKIFVKYINKNYKKIGKSYIFTDSFNPYKKYELSLAKDGGIFKMILKTYLKKKLVKTRIYW